MNAGSRELEEFVVVWRDESDPNRAWTINGPDGAVLRRPLSGVKSSVYAVVTDPDELEEALARADGKRYAAPVEVVAQVLGWEL